MTRLPLGLLLVAGTAFAQRAMSPEALAHFERAQTLMRAKDYEGAKSEFERGRAIDPTPHFDLALGKVYLKLGDCEHAMRSYAAFLDSDPPAEEAKFARHDMAQCPSAAPKQAATETEPEPEPQTTAAVEHDAPPAQPHWYSDVAGGLLAGGGAVGIVVGASYLVSANHAVSAANGSTTVAGLQSQSAAADHDRTLGAVTVVAGGALAAAAVIRYAMVARSHREPDRVVSLTVTPNGGALAVWSGHF